MQERLKIPLLEKDPQLQKKDKYNMKHEHWRKQALDISYISNPIFNIEIHFLTTFPSEI